MVLKLLVIEDDEGVRGMLELLLNYNDHEVIFAKNGYILEELTLMKPDMIFLDEWLYLTDQFVYFIKQFIHIKRFCQKIICTTGQC
jgi:DNA-binding NtrC family response regulator